MNLRNCSLILLLIAGLAPLLTPVAQAGETGTLVVTVQNEPLAGETTDQEVALAGATIRLSTRSDMTSGDFGLRTATTNENGKAVFFHLPPADYWIEAALDGFETRSWKVDVHAGLTRRVSVGLKIPIVECNLGRPWDLRGSLDPGIGPKVTVVRFGDHR